MYNYLMRTPYASVCCPWDGAPPHAGTRDWTRGTAGLGSLEEKREEEGSHICSSHVGLISRGQTDRKYTKKSWETKKPMTHCTPVQMAKITHMGIKQHTYNTRKKSGNHKPTENEACASAKSVLPTTIA